MIFNSLEFLVFFPIVLLIYYIVPKQIQNFWLLLASYCFYGSWGLKYAGLLFLITLLTYIAGLVVGHRSRAVRIDPLADREIEADFSSRVSKKHRNKTSKTLSKEDQRKRLYLALFLCVLFGVLCFYKYTGFLLSNVSALMMRLGVGFTVSAPSLMVPVGMSFFVFQAAGYLIDVYREEMPPESDLLRLALFISFFPSLLSGPIGRAPDLIPQYKRTRSFEWDRFCEGALTMLWGYFMKLVIADRAAILVNFVYGNYHELYGWTIVLATVIYAVEIYCDFCGYSTIATGAAKILGIKLMENFDCPYFSVSVQDFWRRWHISLSSWFRDYLYFPLGGSRCNFIRRYFNILVVFIVSGLWHGSQWSYIVWGALNGLYQIIGNILMPVRTLILGIFGFDKDVLNLKKNPAMAGSMKVYDSQAPAADFLTPWENSIMKKKLDEENLSRRLFYESAVVSSEPGEGDDNDGRRTGLFGMSKSEREYDLSDLKMGILKLVRIMITFALIDFSWLFFRAAGLRDAVLMIKRVLGDFYQGAFSLTDLYNLGLDMKNFWLLIICCIILMMSDYVKYHGGNLSRWILKRPMVIREFIIAAAILFVLIFGIWGNSYDASSFIYFQY